MVQLHPQARCSWVGANCKGWCWLAASADLSIACILRRYRVLLCRWRPDLTPGLSVFPFSRRRNSASREQIPYFSPLLPVKSFFQCSSPLSPSFVEALLSMSYRRSTLLPYNQLPTLSYPSTQYDPIERQRQSDHSLNTNHGESYELTRPRSYSSGQHLLEDSGKDDDQKHTRRQPSSTFSSVKGFAVTGHGLWENQMLVDRSLRSMALLTSLLAAIMCSLVFVCLKDFNKRPNKTSTSVYAGDEDCKAANWKISVRLR